MCRENNVDIYNESVEEYNDFMLVSPEREVLGKLKDHWRDIKMLDIGVGTGRTSFTFSAIVMDYIGIDYSHRMIEKCKALIRENQNIQFALHDATDLSKYYGQDFDFILFSMNGLDSVVHYDRIKILMEVRKILTDDGYFFFDALTAYLSG